jgi:hypothetical protein
MTSYTYDGPVSPNLADSDAYPAFEDNVLEGLKTDSASVGSGRAKYERESIFTPPDAMHTEKFGAFGDEVLVNGESGKAIQWGLAVTTDSDTEVAVNDLSATMTAENDTFGVDGTGEWSVTYEDAEYGGNIPAMKDGSSVAANTDGSQLVDKFWTTGVGISFKLEDELPGASGTEKEQWVDLWEEINTTLNEDHDGSVELTTVYDMEPPDPSTFPSTSKTVTLNSSEPSVHAVPTPSSLTCGLVLMALLGGMQSMGRSRRDRGD